MLASTLYGAATLAAAVDSDRFERTDRCVLLVSNNASVPETTLPLDAMPGFAVLRGRFDEVLSWNDAIFPFHPGGWSPRPDDVPLWERHLRALWNLGDAAVELVVESLQVEPALALVQLFPAAPIDLYADGLMSYGPTRNKLDLLVTTRVRRLLHLDLVPGLTPLLLSEHGVRPELVPTSAFTSVLAQLATATAGTSADTAAAPSADRSPADGPALLLGQYLAALEILTPQEEEDLHLSMLRGAVERGHRRLVFKPHPTAPARWSRMLEQEAARLGADLTVHDTPELAEVLFQRLRPALVVGCFSTALVTASALYGIPVARTGTDLLLERLAPFQNSNRVPVAIVDALFPPLAPPGHRPSSTGELSALLVALGFCMQPQSYPHLRDAATAYLSAHLDDRTRRYFKRKRLAALGLPGALPAGLALPRNPAARRLARRVRHVLRARARRRVAQRPGTPR
ncbi:alpha-2,8-polysialyltransferase family protein [Streptantibioticus silvisoli]|uniref:Alpha-2,8-polysialyltransferase family protein n=1 Tax=Streptantibioticus silvisoli TaxID=2705255 RepID=A0ABT6WAY1_9ACTN|nr:alpha-2,8-polysialyltransferase family protein [Streptantibioticus silvisoli]MDI5967624.1 alpha-2,8-polysialyltransferase family protein [Streptantibioticus silvisoli]